MKPTQVAQRLASMAAEILASNQPDKRLVAQDLRRIAAVVSTPSQVFSQACLHPRKEEYTQTELVTTIDTYCKVNNVSPDVCEQAKVFGLKFIKEFEYEA
jgi:hypothetical protein